MEQTENFSDESLIRDFPGSNEGDEDKQNENASFDNSLDDISDSDDDSTGPDSGKPQDS